MEPTAVYWLATIPIVWCCWFVHRWYRDRRRCQSGIGPILARLAPVTGPRRDLATLLLATLAATVLVAAAARPEAIRNVPQYESVDLIVVLDRSASMLATDIQPSRLSRACLEIENLLRDKPPILDRVALIAFADTAVVTSHLTRDSEILFFFLDWIQKDQHTFYGTNLATALESALTIARTEMPQRRKAIVLISDGDDQGGLLASAIDQVHDARIPVYTIGVGGDRPVTIPARVGSEDRALRDDSGAALVTKFSGATLQRIASATSGEFYRSSTGEELATALAKVAAREQPSGRFREEYTNVEWLPLSVAVCVLSAILVIL
jgi:Ca-activated chloride channel family protein